LADRMDALGAPGPERGAHVMDRGNANSLQLRLDSEVEVRRVDADEEGWTLAHHLPVDAIADAHDLAQVPDHLDVAAHRELFHREERARALGHHLGPGDAEKLHLGPA